MEETISDKISPDFSTTLDHICLAYNKKITKLKEAGKTHEDPNPEMLRDGTNVGIN